MPSDPQTTLLERLWASDEASALTNEAAREIERLREVVWLYVDPATVKPSYKPIVERCKQ